MPPPCRRSRPWCTSTPRDRRLPGSSRRPGLQAFGRLAAQPYFSTLSHLTALREHWPWPAVRHPMSQLDAIRGPDGNIDESCPWVDGKPMCGRRAPRRARPVTAVAAAEAAPTSRAGGSRGSRRGAAHRHAPIDVATPPHDPTSRFAVPLPPRPPRPPPAPDPATPGPPPAAAPSAGHRRWSGRPGRLLAAGGWPPSAATRTGRRARPAAWRRAVHLLAGRTAPVPCRLRLGWQRLRPGRHRLRRRRGRHRGDRPGPVAVASGTTMVVRWPPAGPSAWASPRPGRSRRGGAGCSANWVTGPRPRHRRRPPSSCRPARWSTQVVAGSSHALALTSTGSVYAWGVGAHGQLGDGSTQTDDVPTQVALRPARSSPRWRPAATTAWR